MVGRKERRKERERKRERRKGGRQEEGGKGKRSLILLRHLRRVKSNMRMPINLNNWVMDSRCAWDNPSLGYCSGTRSKGTTLNSLNYSDLDDLYGHPAK